MAKFEKGKSGNPSGRPKATAEQKKIRKLTNEEFKIVGDLLLMNGSLLELKKIQADPNAAPLKSWLASIVLKGIQRGDMSSLNELLNRLIGKVKDQLEIEAKRVFYIRNLEGPDCELGSESVIEIEKE